MCVYILMVNSYMQNGDDIYGDRMYENEDENDDDLFGERIHY